MSSRTSIEYPKEVLESFWSQVNVKDSIECWYWLGKTNAQGYGVWSGAGTHLAHRFMIALKRGVYPGPKEFVLHSCDRRCCVNPNHLTLGSHIDNMKDMVSRGRHGHGLLTPDQIARTLEGYYEHGESIYILSQAMEVPESVIRNVVKGKTYKPIFERWVNTHYEDKE